MRSCSSFRWYRSAAIAVSFQAVVLSGCATPAHTVADDIQIFDKKPTCHYQRLGVVEGRDGHRGHANGQVWGQRGKEERALAALRNAAQALGAHGVILTTRKIQERETDYGSTQKRPSRLVILKGMAISECIDPEQSSIL